MSKLARSQAEFEAQVKAGICIICGRPAQAGTRYCYGDGGCRGLNPKGVSNA